MRLTSRLEKAVSVLSFALLLAPWTSAEAASTVQFGPNILIGANNPFSNYDREPNIALNPVNPDNLVMGYISRLNARDGACYFSTTLDGGMTWTTATAAPLRAALDITRCGDPSLAADLAGNFYFAYIDGDSDNQFTQPSITFDVVKSTDGGRTFPTFSIAVPASEPFIDKPFLGVDARTQSPYQGNLYLTYTRLHGGYQILERTSRDGGQTWTEPILLSRVAPFPAFITGSLPLVAPDGTAYVFYQDTHDVGLFNSTDIMFVKSSNGGVSWSSPRAVRSNIPSPGDFVLRTADHRFGETPDVGIIVTSIPTAAIAPDGTLYVAWTDFPTGSCVFPPGGRAACTNADVRLSVSKNGGNSWRTPVKVSDETSATDQFLPWIAVHPNGLLSLMWMDKRLSPDNVNMDAFYTNTSDGSNFLANVRVSSESSILAASGSYGDYSGLAATADRVFPVWNDSRQNSNENHIFTATGLLSP